MNCSVCKLGPIEYIIIVHYYGDYGNQLEQTETYCGFACLRTVME